MERNETKKEVKRMHNNLNKKSEAEEHLFINNISEIYMYDIKV